MKKFAVILIALFVLSPMSAFAETLSVGENLELRFDVPEGWKVAETAPEFLVNELAEHVLHELAEQDRKVDLLTVREKVNERLSANEGYLFNPKTGAHLIIDFSPLRGEEKAPRKRTVAASARHAGEQFQEEEGIESARFSTDKTRLPGTDIAYRVEADYIQHDLPKKFIGIVGFTNPYWFFLYYTDPLQDSADAKAAEKILESLAVVKGS